MILAAVQTKKAEGTRISLSFNTFLKGELGSIAKTTYLNITKNNISIFLLNLFSSINPVISSTS